MACSAAGPEETHAHLRSADCPAGRPVRINYLWGIGAAIADGRPLEAPAAAKATIQQAAKMPRSGQFALAVDPDDGVRWADALAAARRSSGRPSAELPPPIPQKDSLMPDRRPAGQSAERKMSMGFFRTGSRARHQTVGGPPLFPMPLPAHAPDSGGGRRRNRLEIRPFVNRGTKETPMRYLIAAGGLALIACSVRRARARNRAGQATGRSGLVSQSVKALPSTAQTAQHHAALSGARGQTSSPARSAPRRARSQDV